MTMPNLTLVIPELFLLGMICLILMVAVFVKKRNLYTVYVLTQITVVISVLLSGHHIVLAKAQTSFHNSFIIDHLALVTKFCTYFVAFFAFVYARTEIKKLKMPAGEYYALALFSMLGMMMLVSASNLLTFYLGLELLSLPLYVLVAINRRSVLGAEAAMKYFVTGALASGLLLFGMSLIYGASHSLDFSQIAHAFNVSDVIKGSVKEALQGHYSVTVLSEGASHIIMLTGVSLIVAGLAFKLGLAPFHMWTPDVYEGAPVSIALFISSVPKIATLAVLIRFLINCVQDYSADWKWFLIALAVTSIAWGNLAAIAQTNLKRMFAYSSVAHMGYAILGVIAGTTQGLGAAMFYIVTYAVSAAGAFGILIVLKRGDHHVEAIEDLNGLNGSNPWLAFLMLLLLFSMAGVPPLVGFVAKLSVILALIKVHLVWLAVYALVFAIIASYYYLRVVKAMYFDPCVSPEMKTPVGLMVITTINGIAVLAMGIFPTFIIGLTHLSFI